MVLVDQLPAASIPYLRWMVTCMRIPRANVEGTREMPGTMSAQVHRLTTGLRIMRTLAVTAAAAVSQMDQVR
jgi:hypothetical protein